MSAKSFHPVTYRTLFFCSWAFVVVSLTVRLDFSYAAKFKCAHTLCILQGTRVQINLLKESKPKEDFDTELDEIITTNCEFTEPMSFSAVSEHSQSITIPP